MRMVASLPLLTLCIARPGCAATANVEYLPLAVGMRYVMDLEAVDPAGKTTRGKAYRQINQRVERDGKVYFKTRTWAEGGPFPVDYTKLLRKDATGMYSVDERNSNGREQREIALPLKLGSKWEWTAPMGVLKCSVVAKEFISAGGKQYRDCFRIKQESADGKYTEEWWEAPGVGSVRSIMRVSGGTITLTLREFTRAAD